MLATLEDKKKEYAALLIRIGLDVRQGHRLLIHAPVDAAPFARLCMEEAYAAGAAEVQVIWGDDAVTRAHFLHADDTYIERTPEWRKVLMNGYAKEGVSRLFIEATDPMNLAGVDPDRLLRSARAKGKDFAEFYRLETTYIRRRYRNSSVHRGVRRPLRYRTCGRHPRGVGG